MIEFIKNLLLLVSWLLFFLLGYVYCSEDTPRIHKTETECLAELPRNQVCEMVWVVKKEENNE